MLTDGFLRIGEWLARFVVAAAELGAIALFIFALVVWLGVLSGVLV